MNTVVNAFLSGGAQAHRDAGPSELAAKKRASRFAGSLRGRALAAIVAAGDDGLTVLEALDVLGLPERRRYSLAPRLSELLDDGRVEKGEIRDECVAYVATEAGVDLLEDARLAVEAGAA